MLLRIEHRTRYDYGQPIGLSPHIVRLFPRAEPGRLVQRFRFETNATAIVHYRRDLFDNNHARCFYPDPDPAVFFDYTLEVDLQPHNAFGFLLENHAINYPFAYEPPTAAVLAPFLTPPPDDAGHTGGPSLLPLSFWERPSAPTPTVSVLQDLMSAIRGHLRYERRDEGQAHAPVELLRLGVGTCRDYAVLMASILRELGLAARLASGYLSPFGPETPPGRSEESAMHMWTEVYLPGAGWTGLDPTNGVLCDQNYITTAVGLTSAEVTPISGRYFSNVVVPSNMTASLTLSRV